MRVQADRVVDNKNMLPKPRPNVGFRVTTGLGYRRFAVESSAGNRPGTPRPNDIAVDTLNGSNHIDRSDRTRRPGDKISTAEKTKQKANLERALALPKSEILSMTQVARKTPFEIATEALGKYVEYLKQETTQHLTSLQHLTPDFSQISLDDKEKHHVQSVEKEAQELLKSKCLEIQLYVRACFREIRTEDSTLECLTNFIERKFACELDLFEVLVAHRPLIDCSLDIDAELTRADIRSEKKVQNRLLEALNRNLTKQAMHNLFQLTHIRGVQEFAKGSFDKTFSYCWDDHKWITDIAPKFLEAVAVGLSASCKQILKENTYQATTVQPIERDEIDESLGSVSSKCLNNLCAKVKQVSDKMWAAEQALDEYAKALYKS